MKKSKNLLMLFSVAIIPVIDLTRIIGWLKQAVVTALIWVAFRAFILSVIATALPIAIYFGWAKISQYIFEAVNAQAGTGGYWSGTMIQFTGLAAWVATRLRLPECMSLLLSAMGIRFALGFIRR